MIDHDDGGHDIKRPRVIVCGIGSSHFIANYIPVLSSHRSAPLVVAGTELPDRINGARRRIRAAGLPDTTIVPVQPISSDGELSPSDPVALDAIANNESLDGVFIVTEATAHLPYLKWALRRGLPCLVEKPLTSHVDVSHRLDKARQLIDDFAYLNQLASENRSFLSIVSQRRWNKAFLFVKDRIEAAFDRYEAPVSLMRGMKNKGDWMEPSLLVSKENHPYKYGYGVLSHTGYHPIDVMDYTISGVTSELGADRGQVFAQTTFPRDVYKFRSRSNREPNGSAAFAEASLGECTVNGLFAYFADEARLVNANVMISNHGISQRDFSKPGGGIWDQTVGTVRQESYTWSQGPFQEIDLEIYQDRTDAHDSAYDYGGSNYGLITIKTNGRRGTVERVSIAEFEADGRRAADACLDGAIMDFIDRLCGEEIIPRSDIATHEVPIKLVSCLYQSSIGGLPVSFEIMRSR